MRRLTYSLGVSLDGYIVGRDGGYQRTAPDEEVFRFVIDEIRQVGSTFWDGGVLDERLTDQDVGGHPHPSARGRAWSK